MKTTSFCSFAFCRSWKCFTQRLLITCILNAAKRVFLKIKIKEINEGIDLVYTPVYNWLNALPRLILRPHYKDFFHNDVNSAAMRIRTSEQKREQIMKRTSEQLNQTVRGISMFREDWSCSSWDIIDNSD